MEQNRPSGAMHGQIAMHIGGAFASMVDRRALKRNRRKLLGIEKFSREQVMVAILDTSVDALNLNGRLYARSLRLGRIENHHPRKLSKLTDHAGRKMANLKT